MKATPEPKSITPGHTYERNRYEVHTFLDNGKWSVLIRSAETLEEAKKMLAERKAWDSNLRGFVDFGPFPRCRIVKVEATVTVVEA